MGCGGAALPVDRRRNRFGARCGAGRRLWGVAAPCPLLLARGSGAQDTASPRGSQDGRCYFVTAAAPPRYLCAVASRNRSFPGPSACHSPPVGRGGATERDAWERKFIGVDTNSKNAPPPGIVTDARRRRPVTSFGETFEGTRHRCRRPGRGHPAPRPAPRLHAYSFQIRSAYSRTERSLLKKPERATLTIAIRVHFSSSAKVTSTWAWAAR